MSDFKTLICLFLLFLFSACSPEHDDDFGNFIPNSNADPALAQAASELLGLECASCHGVNGTNPRFLNTEADPDVETLKDNSRYVKIGQGSRSLLYLRSSDGSMPPNNPLSAEEAQVLKDWIDDLGVLVEDSEE